jgi:hypothetical protein
MRRTSVMTLGFVLIFVGVQLHMVETFVLTPRFSNFLAENARQVQVQPVAAPVANPAANANYNSPYYQASHSNVVSAPRMVTAMAAGPQQLTPPRWLCWPVLCIGGVVFLHGLSRRHD